MSPSTMGNLYMGVKKMFMYNKVFKEMNDDISFFDMSKTF
jgi:hypothetical protein